MGLDADRVVVVGAGIGGLATALRLAAAGRDVTVVEAQAAPGGKMRAVPSPAGPVDAGPTVLTLRDVFDDLFAVAGTTLDAHLRLVPQPVVARHWWPDGATLDLFSDRERSAAAIRGFGGAGAEHDFRRFCARADALFAAFDRPVMRSARPDVNGILAAVIRRPAIWPALLPGRSLARQLAQSFRDARLAQLFGRYATYVGGQPALSPAVLALIWPTEERGVWAVEGGMHRLAEALARVARDAGATFRFGTKVERVLTQFGRAAGVRLEDGAVIQAGAVVFNGDPAALRAGFLGPDLRDAVPGRATGPHSHSAWVWSFAARATGVAGAAGASGPSLAHHNVFFSAHPESEYAPLARGAEQTAPSIYICAEDRASGVTPGGPERFEIILNAPPTDLVRRAPDRRETERCQTLTFTALARFGLTFDPLPDATALTGPARFAALFPGSQGSLYGMSPHGMMATFRRPGARTRIPGLWLAGGGTHPGAGVPMAALSGRHAAEAILRDRASTSRSARTAMPGGTSTGSVTTDPAPSRS